MPTPGRSIRVPDDLWARVNDRAETDQTDASHVAREAFERYLAADEHDAQVRRATGEQIAQAIEAGHWVSEEHPTTRAARIAREVTQ